MRLGAPAVRARKDGDAPLLANVARWLVHLELARSDEGLLGHVLTARKGQPPDGFAIWTVLRFCLTQRHRSLQEPRAAHHARRPETVLCVRAEGLVDASAARETQRAGMP